MTVAYRLRISGRVQGVGFRVLMQRQADRLGIGGWVRNRRDGTVEALVQGGEAPVQELLGWCRRGPSGARVSTVAAEPTPPEPGRAGFSVEPTA